MYLLAVSPPTETQIGRLSPQEQQIWRRLAPSIVMIEYHDQSQGPAALIDRQGLFVAHRNAVPAADVTGRLADGSTIQLHLLSTDALSQLVLLQASKWERTSAQPFLSPDGNERPGVTLLAVLNSGPIRAEFVSGNRFGVIKPTRRMMPLNEFRFEAPAEAIGTALVFSESGELMGALSAALAPIDTSTGPFPGTGLSNPRPRPIPGLGNPIGPSPLTVAYTAAAPVVRRVLDGFRSPSHQVQYPSLGVMCINAIGGGAFIQKIVDRSPAAQAGFRVGDVIVDIGGKLIHDQVDFARVMLNQEIDKKVTIRIRRGPDFMVLEPTVASNGD